MQRTHTRRLLIVAMIISMLWFKSHPVIQFSGPDTFAETAANLMVAAIVAMLGVVAITSFGRAAGWWKD